MGMFDDIKCKYPLPLDGANALDYQTKDTDAQNLDNYEIREDGTLWLENRAPDAANDKTLATGGVVIRSNEAGKPSTQE